MAKELPYFKFEPAEYLTKDISFCSLSAQGLFINICSYYWQRDCKLTKDQLLRRLNYETELNELIMEGIVDLYENNIFIKFLDKQLIEVELKSKTNSFNGSKGGRPKKNPIKSETKAKQNPIKSETKAKQNPIKSESISEIKGIREDKIRLNKIKEDNIINNTPEIKNFGDGDLDKNLINANILKFESPIWLESVSMQQKIPIEDIKNKIDEFVLFLQTTQTEHKIKKAFLEHFINWLPKKLNSEKNGKQQFTNTGTKKQFRFSTADALETLARQNK